MNRKLQTALVATAVAGTLDLASAFVFAGMSGRGPVAVMAGVAAGPFGDGMRDQGLAGALVGTLVHFSIMFIMASTFVIAFARWPALRRQPLLSGAVCGLLLYIFMYWIVLVLRWPAVFPRTDAWTIGNALFSHIICVGIPITLVTARMLPGEQRKTT